MLEAESVINKEWHGRGVISMTIEQSASRPVPVKVYDKLNGAFKERPGAVNGVTALLMGSLTGNMVGGITFTAYELSA
ncbi:hypothetical protein CBS147343_5104 [Aspergillus niger]|uniref:Lactonase, 7-bladed beta-propeller family protein n=1 Tax=Aspergillus niger TaxID=5061 RepID=A0A254U8H1_ASPNG|nr:hypothetical protein CBS147371_9142 [Aspergillus niger]KAI2941436.1 hypothetical protein CBS147321_5875 [Aspergillus niger]KAI2954582.1 hypothetical protein CBS147322_3671 [Aspergillus niger]KAI2974136.1 hypothetical protein CBS147323_1525 [Aspergillus niger]KAI2990139.1 hypothetical protein CBS147344_2482 [Aspergillus niger]